MFKPQYEAQAGLLIECIPQVAKHGCFALKGGTAINLFFRDLPRVAETGSDLRLVINV